VTRCVRDEKTRYALPRSNVLMSSTLRSGGSDRPSLYAKSPYVALFAWLGSMVDNGVAGEI
jgi:hypothetical protein